MKYIINKRNNIYISGISKDNISYTNYIEDAMEFITLDNAKAIFAYLKEYFNTEAMYISSVSIDIKRVDA